MENTTFSHTTYLTNDIGCGDIRTITIGQDDRLYLVTEENKILVLSVNWDDGAITEREQMDFSANFTRVMAVHPIGSEYLVIGIPSTSPRKPGESYITDRGGTILRAIFLGALSTKTCLVDNRNHIVIGYYDEAIFGNGRVPGMSAGLVIWNAEGEKLAENTRYSLADVTALNVDDKNRIYLSDWGYPLICFSEDLSNGWDASHDCGDVSLIGVHGDLIYIGDGVCRLYQETGNRLIHLGNWELPADEDMRTTCRGDKLVLWNSSKFCISRFR